MASPEGHEGGSTKICLTHDGPTDGVSYPVNTLYCAECGLPVEYCEFNSEEDYEKCKRWLKDNIPDEFERLSISTPEGEGEKEEGEKKKRQTRGGRSAGKSSKKNKAQPQKICVFKSTRGKKKCVTVVTGLGSHEIDLREASKLFGQKFATGSSVPNTGDDEIVIQGDVKLDLIDLIMSKWPKIPEDMIDDLGVKSR